MDFGLLFAFENPRPWQVSSAQLYFAAQEG